MQQDVHTLRPQELEHGHVSLPRPSGSGRSSRSGASSRVEHRDERGCQGLAEFKLVADELVQDEQEERDRKADVDCGVRRFEIAISACIKGSPMYCRALAQVV